MNKLPTIIAVLAAAITAHAELDTKEFDLVKAWAEKQGYVYDGIAKRFNALVFKHKTGVIVFAPVTSDTADEAINALIASKVTNAFHAETAKNKADPEQLSKADQEGEEPNLVAQNKIPEAPETMEATATPTPAGEQSAWEAMPIPTGEGAIEFKPGAKEESTPEIPKRVMARIEADAAKDWPGNYIMQELVIEAQTEAYLNLH